MEEVIKDIDIMIKNTKENLRNLKIIRSYLNQLDEKEKYKDEHEIKSIEKIGKYSENWNKFYQNKSYATFATRYLTLCNFML